MNRRSSPAMYICHESGVLVWHTLAFHLLSLYIFMDCNLLSRIRFIMSHLPKTNLFLFLFLFLLPFISTPARSASNTFTLPPLSFSTLLSASAEIRNLTSFISRYATIPLNPRLSLAIRDCLDLLDLSSDELAWTLTATSSVGATKGPSTSNPRIDVHSWLSAAVGNQQTCRESLQTIGSLKFAELITGSLEKITALISDVLSQVFTSPSAKDGNSRARRLMVFPEWLSPRDRRLLLGLEDEEIPDVVVAKDGSGNYSTVTDAVDAAPSKKKTRYVIYVKKGVYQEYIDISKNKWNLMLIGDGINQTIITGNHSNAANYTTYRSATLAVNGRGFMAKDLTVRNSAGPEGHQAVAIRSDSDLSVFYRCSFDGYQDTLYAHSLRQFYRECVITGTIDYIFGDSTVVFQNCTILSRLPLPKQNNTVSAQGRTNPNENTGFSFQFCNVSADTNFVKYTSTVATYLGRPWRDYSRTVFMQSYLGDLIWPEGWLPWPGRNSSALSTLYYAEYNNSGPGSPVDGRVNWPGYHVLTNDDEAIPFTVEEFIEGDEWLPATGVVYTDGLHV